MSQYMEEARREAGKSRCLRAHVGCVIVDDTTGKVVARGYNRTRPHMEPCDVNGCSMQKGHCVSTEHAEEVALNALGDEWGRFTLYVTHFPCVHCAVAILPDVRITRVVYGQDYRSNSAIRDVFNVLEGGIVEDAS